MKKKRRNKLLHTEEVAAYLYLIPALIGLIVLTYIPLAAVFGLSFLSGAAPAYRSLWASRITYGC